MKQSSPALEIRKGEPVRFLDIAFALIDPRTGNPWMVSHQLKKGDTYKINKTNIVIAFKDGEKATVPTFGRVLFFSEHKGFAQEIGLAADQQGDATAVPPKSGR